MYNVETVRFLYREPLKLGVDDKRTNYTSFSGIGKYYVTAIRYVQSVAECGSLKSKEFWLLCTLNAIS